MFNIVSFFQKKSVKKDLKKHAKKDAKATGKRSNKRHIVKSNNKCVAIRNIPTPVRMQTHIPGFDQLIEKGIPRYNSILLAGGPGTGKTILSLQILANQAKKGRKCLYISFEESVERLLTHMEDFCWGPEKLIADKNLKIVRKEPSLFATNIEAMLERAKGELLIDINEILEIIPKGFKPDMIVIDSISSISTAFPNKGTNYRIFLEQLFRYLESLNVTSFLISEVTEKGTGYIMGGVEEFLADGVILLYNLKNNDVRQPGIEILKMRGAKHEKKIVPMQITDKGIEIYPDERVFNEFG